MIPFSVWIILYPVLNINVELHGKKHILNYLLGSVPASICDFRNFAFSVLVKMTN